MTNHKLNQYQQMINSFKKELTDDADVSEVMNLIGTGYFNTNQERVLNALEQNSWLGFDYPSQAISAAYTELDRYYASDELLAAINSK